MAFENNNLILLQTAGDRGALFLYKEDAALATITAADYFNEAVGINNLLRDGDVAIIVANNGIALAKFVVSNEGKVTVVTA